MNYNNLTKQQLINLVKKKDNQIRKEENKCRYAWKQYYEECKLGAEQNTVVRTIIRKVEDDIPIYLENEIKEIMTKHNHKYDCVICLDNIEGKDLKVVRCGHFFHKECIGEWLKRKNSCPNCRKKISK